MCTVVVRWQQGAPLRVLALRDELAGRPFDDPGAWWPEAPGVIGGRDRQAGGTWCASEVAAGSTAVVLNRPQRRTAAPGAPSRGVLPLAALRHGADWPAAVPLEGMASFAVLLATPSALLMWEHDGEQLRASEVPPGTHMVTSGAEEDQRPARHLGAFTGADPDGWRALVTAAEPADDPSSLLVEHAVGDRVYRTVFGQLLRSVPGRLDVSWSRTPGDPATWTARRWPA